MGGGAPPCHTLSHAAGLRPLALGGRAWAHCGTRHRPPSSGPIAPASVTGTRLQPHRIFDLGRAACFPFLVCGCKGQTQEVGGPFSPPQAWGPAWPKQPDLLSLGFTDCGVSHCPQAQATSKLSGKSLHRWERIGTGHLQSTAAGGLPRLPSLLLSAASLPRQTSPAPRSPKPCALRARTAGWDQKVPPHPRAAGPSPRPRSLCDQGCGEWHCRGADDPGYSRLFLLMAPPCLPGSSNKGAG